MNYLVKHSNIEFGKTWWFLNIVIDLPHFEWCKSKIILKHFKDIKVAKFIKRYASEEELNIDVDLHFNRYKMKYVS
jgi:hypothetical protein